MWLLYQQELPDGYLQNTSNKKNRKTLMNTLPKLGKLAPKHDPRTLKLADYLTPDYQFPKERRWTDKVSRYSMKGNDKIGDCGAVGLANMIQTWTANSGKEVNFTDEQVIEIYSKLSGYNPRTGENDNGVVLLDLLKEWKNVGFFGHKIGAFAYVNPKNVKQIKYAINTFGGTLNGIALPIISQQQTIWEEPFGADRFSDDAKPGSWGGHCTFGANYNEKKLENVTWAMEKKTTFGYMSSYGDEMFAIFSPDFINEKGAAPNGILRDALLRDLSML